MTDEEWLDFTDPWPMLELIVGKSSDRKLRLFACAGIRLLPYWKDERFQQALEASESYADGQTTKAALKRGRQAVRQARFALPADDSKVHGEWSAYWLAEVAASENAVSGVGSEMQRLADLGILRLSRRMQASICRLLRDIFGTPSRPVVPERKWLKSEVVNLAQEIYDGTAFERLPALAEALEEAGCDDAELLTHCRAPGPHVKGCWLVDGLLRKK